MVPSELALTLKIHLLSIAFRPFGSSTRHHISFAVNASNSASIASIYRSQSSWLNASCSVSGFLDTCGMYSSARLWLLPWIGRSQSLCPVVRCIPTATSFEYDWSSVLSKLPPAAPHARGVFGALRIADQDTSLCLDSKTRRLDRSGFHPARFVTKTIRLETLQLLPSLGLTLDLELLFPGLQKIDEGHPVRIIDKSEEILIPTKRRLFRHSPSNQKFR